MSRIRSIHPGQWTDEAFVSVSAFARLLAIAIRNEADDNGCFEWKPLRLKMRLFPADDVNIEDLLAELTQANLLQCYEVAGIKYGAIRNFRKWQRPEKPKFFCPLPDELLFYIVGDQSATNRRPVGDQSANLSAEGRKEGRKEGKKDIKDKSFIKRDAREKKPEAPKITPDQVTPELIGPDWIATNAPAVNAATELDAWRDWLKSKRKTYSDYPAAARNWLRNQQRYSNERKPHNGHAKQPYSPFTAMAEGFARAAAKPDEERDIADIF
jgi:hypothetical protein